MELWNIKLGFIYVCEQQVFSYEKTLYPSIKFYVRKIKEILSKKLYFLLRNIIT